MEKRAIASGDEETLLEARRAAGLPPPPALLDADIQAVQRLLPEEERGIAEGLLPLTLWADVVVSPMPSEGSDCATTVVEAPRTATATASESQPGLPANEDQGSRPAEMQLVLYDGAGAFRQRAIAAWEGLQAELRQARARETEARKGTHNAWSHLDDFLQEFGDLGRELAGPFPQAIADARQARAVGQEWLQAEKERRAEEKKEKARQEALEREREARRELERHRYRSDAITEELQARVNSAMADRLRIDGRDMPRRSCRFCGLVGVMRGRECPRRHLHQRE